ncbi:MAG: 3-hydroxylaminophenol mutase [Holosporales bacterium]
MLQLFSNLIFLSMMKKTLGLIKNHRADFVHFRFIDTHGQWHDISYHVSMINEEIMTQGFMFDGSSLEGWKSIEDSDMILRPDDETAFVDPFKDVPSVCVICTVIDPKTNEMYSRDPRSTAIRAQRYLTQSGIADEVRFGPEPEFFVYDQVNYSTNPEHSFYKITSTENPSSAAILNHEESSSHFAPHKGSYCSVSPKDLTNDLRSQMILNLLDCGVPVEKHHHEVSTSQHELGMRFANTVQSGDWICIYKQVVKEVAHSFGKTATFMPKPVPNDNGSGMHVHQSLLKNGENLFAGNEYGGLSKMALSYIAGILHHGKALNAFTNPTINSYRRLVPGFEAPTLAVYSARNRSAACRIPHTISPKARRIETRFPDPSCNPYLALSALLMAGLDGIQNNMDPGAHWEKNLYDLSVQELKDLPSLATSLEEALYALDQDRAFLTKGGVFTDEQIDAYLNIKWAEVKAFHRIPTPKDYELYFSC